MKPKMYELVKRGGMVTCFACECMVTSESARDDGHAQGDGRYSVKCGTCQYRTWFDFEEGT